MKKTVYFLSILLIALIRCSKDDIPASPYIGEYKGTVIDSGFHATGTFTDTLKDYTITITHTSYSPDLVFLHNGLLNTKEGKLIGNNFTIEKRLAFKDEFFEKYEWAEGTFSEGTYITWTINFYSELVNKDVVIARIRRNGVFIKQ